MSQEQLSLKEQVAALPLLPGIYQFVDSRDTIIYVGKAKSLRKRVSSYFVDSREHSSKVRVMVKQIVEIRHIIVATENDALLLENSLIKQLQPRYNILLKDDKSYPWITIRHEEFPRIESTRRLLRDGSEYFGPYASIAMQRAILEFIRDVIPLRTCKLNLAPDKIASGKYGVCLQYHIGNCKAPCVGAQTAEEYSQLIALARSVLKGDLRPVRAYLEEGMQRASEELKFEAAQRFKQRLTALDNYASRSVIVSAKIVDVDIFSLLVEDEATVYCNFVRIREGSVVAVSTIKLDPGIETERSEILAAAIANIVENITGDISSEIIVPFTPAASSALDKVAITIPKRGEKLDLLHFSERSARLFRAEEMKNLEIKNPDRHTDRLMAAMQKELRLSKPPRHIECFDNSNLQGTNPVASCVVFRDGRPSRKEYRHFNIKTVVGADDFASMREIIFRRYTRLMAEGGTDYPDLIIVDGGKGQLSSAYGVLCQIGLEKTIPIVGLAKRIEEVFYPNDPEPYNLSRNGEPLKVICHLRDEAHRFGITFHRQKRSKNFIQSELEQIDGIGKKSIEAIIRHFGSVARLKAAPHDQVEKVVGKSKSQKIFDYFSE